MLARPTVDLYILYIHGPRPGLEGIAQVAGVRFKNVQKSYGEVHVLRDIDLEIHDGEFMVFVGPSGCGKSTLLRVLGGQLKTRGGEVLMNGIPLYGNLPNLKPYIGYIPQEDAFDPLLKVQENLDFSVAVRCPHLKEEDRRKRVEAKLAELGLADMRKRLAGTPEQKFLSGGERKRLNAGLDMIGISDVYLFDEPTSGLSSKDSEHVLEIIRSLARNKLVLVSIHQPSMRLLQMFDKMASAEIFDLACDRARPLFRESSWQAFEMMELKQRPGEEVAQTLGLSVRTMQRRLGEAGSSFGDLLCEVRRELVQRYLENPRHSLVRVSQMLGYGSPSAFTRWFVRQFGQAPQRWRMQAVKRSTATDASG